MIEPDHPRLSIVRQCGLVSISRSSFYYAPAMTRHLRRLGHVLGRKRVRRLMRLMGLAPIYQKPKTSDPHPHHRIYPYLLRGLTIDRSHRDVGHVSTPDLVAETRGPVTSRSGFGYGARFAALIHLNSECGSPG